MGVQFGAKCYVNMILKGGGKSLNAEGEGVGQSSLSMTSQAINKIFFS